MHMSLFILGIIEMFIITAWTKAVSKTQVLASGIITVVNIMIWYYVLRTVVENISNWQLVLLYAGGCALGTVLCTYYYQRTERAKDQSKQITDMATL